MCANTLLFTVKNYKHAINLELKLNFAQLIAFPQTIMHCFNNNIGNI